MEDGPPRVSYGDFALDPDIALGRQQPRPFSAEKLAAALGHGCSPRAIKAYLQSHPRETIELELNVLVRQHHILTYALERNDAECLKVIMEYGADLKAKAFGDIPLLAYAIMRTKWTLQNATDVVKTLLVYGADSRCIPQDMWSEYVKTPKAETDHKATEPSLITRTKWCTPDRRAVLAETLNLTMRYYLWRAKRLEPPTKRTLQIAKAHKMTDLFKVPFQIIGQEPATNLVVQNIYTHIALRTPKPLVLAFAGLPGHGKTELAGQLGRLLSVSARELDCTQIGEISSLLGAPKGYEGHREVSPLNDFLTQNSGVRCVVFMDEFDKTKMDVREALLKVMDTGMHRDRKSNLEIDASQVIWILATNLGDTVISRFHSKHIATRKDADIDKISIEPLRKDLRSLFRSAYSPAIAGRINVMVPFFPFSPNEQAVVAHKFVLDMQDKARQPIDINAPQLQFMAHSHIFVVDDGKVCQHIADTSYEPEEGARSISAGVDDMRRKFGRAYSNTDEEVTDEMNNGPLTKFTVQLHPVSETDEDEITVFRDGSTVVAGPRGSGK